MHTSQGPDAALDDSGVPEFSVIITCFFEERTIDEFYTRLSKAIRGLGRTYEIIFVNDGSDDATFEHLQKIFEADERVSAVLNLYRNSGQDSAMMAGICEARGKAYFFMDSDLQLNPEDAPKIVSAFFDENYDVVTGCRQVRKDSLFRKLPSLLANIIMRRIARHDLKDFGCTFKIFDSKLVRAFEPGPTKTFRPADVIAQAGRVKEVPVGHRPRADGRSGWTFAKLWTYNMDNVVVLSKRPFQVLAFMALVGATLFSVRIVLGYFSSFQILPPVTNALLLNALLAGTLLLLVVLSVMGEFVIRSFTTLRENPRYVIREALRREWEPHKVVGNAGTDVGAPGDREKATNPTKGDDSP